MKPDGDSTKRPDHAGAGSRDCIGQIEDRFERAFNRIRGESGGTYPGHTHISTGPPRSGIRAVAVGFINTFLHAIGLDSVARLMAESVHPGTRSPC